MIILCPVLYPTPRLQYPFQPFPTCELNTGIAANRISSAKYGFISVISLKALDWTYYSIPHSLGSVPEFILLTPMTMNAGRFAWKVTALTDTTINIDIYNWESSGYSVAFYYLITK